MPFQRGAPKGNRNRWRHWLYSKALMERKAAIRQRRATVRLVLQRVNIILRLQDALERKRARVFAARPLRRKRPALGYKRTRRPLWAAAIRSRWKPPRVLGFTICIDPRDLGFRIDREALRFFEEGLVDGPPIGGGYLIEAIDCIVELNEACTAIENGRSFGDVMKAVYRKRMEERQERQRQWHAGKAPAPVGMVKDGDRFCEPAERTKKLGEYLEEDAQLNEKPGG